MRQVNELKEKTAQKDAEMNYMRNELAEMTKIVQASKVGNQRTKSNL